MIEVTLLISVVTLGGGFIFVGFGLFTLYEAIQYFR